MSNFILVVDDDDEFLDTVSFLLRDSGYRVCGANNKERMLAAMTAKSPDLILLDVNLGADSGFEIALEVRKSSNIPIIMLTGKGMETDRVVGLELGADDYVTKPYSSAELLARVKAVLRRSKMTMSQSESTQSRIASFDGWKCDLDRRQLFSPDGSSVSLTSGEYMLLTAFLENAGKTMSRDRLLDLTGRDSSFDRSIDVQIMRLRRKLVSGDEATEMIRSVRSVGYIFNPKIEWE